MDLRKQIAAIVVAVLLLPFASPAQCSDAGVCSIGGAEEPTQVLIFNGAVSYGRSSDESLSFTDYHVGVQAVPMENLSVSLSLPYRTMTGPLGSTSGIGDLLIAGRYRVWAAHDLTVSLEAGARLATGPVNEGQLPQAYQPGLGTTDALLGVSVMGDRWSVSAGYQYAPGRSKNAVNQLRRGDDISLRGSYIVSEETAIIKGEAIIIHKLQESDGYYLRTSSGSYQFAPGGNGIPNTDRTQINLVGDVSYPFGSGIILQIRGAMALLARPVNVDGLKRNFTLQAGCSVPLL